MRIWAIILFATTSLTSNFTNGAELLRNGNFEGGSSNGIPSFWTYDSTGQLMSTAAQSPFTDVYPSSSTAVLMTTPHIALRQYFPATDGRVSLSFDFMMPEIRGSYWYVSLQGVSSGSARIPFNLRMDGQFWPTGGSSLLSLEPMVWYHVQTEVDLEASLYHGSITPFGEAPVSWSNYRTFSGITGIHEVLISTAQSDLPDHAPIYFDNFSVVPEPTPLALFAITLIVLVPLARIQKR